MAPTVTLVGSFESIDGSAVSTGTITAILRGYGSEIPRIAGAGILDQTTITASISNGSFTLGPFFGNDVILPGPLTTFYEITMPGPDGTTITKQYQFAGGGSFDLAQLLPFGTALRGNNTLQNSVTPQIFTAQSHKFLTGLTATGAFSSAQPSASDISNTVGIGSAVLASGVTGSGNAVLATSPTLTTPTIGAATATSINKVALTAPTTAATLAFGTDNATVTFQGTDTYVGRATTDTLSNKTLTGGSSGNAITLMNAQTSGNQITGTGSAATLYTYTMPASTVGNLKGFRLTAIFNHSNGSASVTYLASLNGVGLYNPSNTAGGVQGFQITILNTGSTTATLGGFAWGGLQSFIPGGNLTGLAWGSSQVLNLTFTVAATDGVTPIQWLVELIQ